MICGIQGDVSSKFYVECREETSLELVLCTLIAYKKHDQPERSALNLQMMRSMSSRHLVSDLDLRTGQSRWHEAVR